MKKIKALFLDRDGVINRDLGYVSKIENFKFLDGIFEALRGFMELEYSLFVVTNQSGIGRGYYSLQDFLNLNEYMLNNLKKHNVFIKKVYFCPHSPEEQCECRKPRPGMILRAAKEFNIDLEKSVLIGDKDSDILAAKNAKVGRSFKLKQGISVLDIYNKEK